MASEQAVENDVAAPEKTKGFWTPDRVVIYVLLAIAVIIALNDYRIRKDWESDFKILDTAVTASKTGGSENDSGLVTQIRIGGGVDQWLADNGYDVAEEHSGRNERVFVSSSGFRHYWVIVDYVPYGKEANAGEAILNVSRENYYFWEKLPELPTSDAGGNVANGGDGPGDSPVASMGGGGGGQRGSSGGQRGSSGGQRGSSGGGGFDPEAIFKGRDEDGDGLLSGDEISDRMKTRMESIDTDEDDAISLEEFTAMITAMRASSQQGRGGGGVDPGINDAGPDPFESDEQAENDVESTKQTSNKEPENQGDDDDNK